MIEFHHCLNRYLALRPLTAGLLSAAVLLLAPLAARAQDPGTPGPFAVTETSYDDGDTAFTPSDFVDLLGPSIDLAVEVRATVHHPTNLSAGPFPLVVFLHGMHSICFSGTSTQNRDWPCLAGSAPIPNHQGYDYISDVLASHGYIVISISSNGVVFGSNSVADGGALARAEVVQHHLEKWDVFNTAGGPPFGSQFVGNVDLANVGTMGHSRGGEGVVRHFILNQSLGAPFGIQAVMPIAPTDFNRDVINDVDLTVVLPYCDGDVSDLQGVRFYDDARYNVAGDTGYKHSLLVMGANHNYYNTVWTSFPAGAGDDWVDFIIGGASDPFCGTVAGNGRLSAAVQRGTGLAFVNAFFRRYLGGETAFMPILVGDQPPPPSALGATIHPSYHPPDNPGLRKDVNRLLVGGNLTNNNLAGGVSQNGLIPYQLCGGQPPQPAHCLSGQPSARQPHTTNSVDRGLSQLDLGWSATTGSWVNELPAGQRNVSGFFALQFRAGVNFTTTTVNPPGTPQDFSVQLVDGGGTTAPVPVSVVSDALYFPPGEMGPVPHLVLNTVRIPLASFVGVDLTDIRRIELNFDQNASGDLMVTDLAFTNVALPVDAFFVVDLSGSFADDLPLFKTQAPGIVANLQAFSSDVRFGLGMFVDYPIAPFGDELSGDQAYQRILDFTADGNAVVTAINGLTTFFGADGPESQLVALFQAATGAGQTVTGFPAATIPAGQQASFRDGVTKLFLLWTDAAFHRPGDPGSIPYPGPSFQDTVDAILALDPPRVMGISSGGGGIADLEEMAVATSALATADVDCDGDGTTDIPAGEPLVCTIAANGVGISDAIVTLVSSGSDVAGLAVGVEVRPGSDPPVIVIRLPGILPVAILTSSKAAGDVVDFDATTVDPETVAFGPGGAHVIRGQWFFEDVDGDGDLDLLLDFRIEDAGIIEGQTEVMLTGSTFGGDLLINGSDAIRTVGSGIPAF